jgi:serine/threonine-protein kinase
VETASEELPPGIPRPGAIFADRCRILSVLGVGGMGVVLAAHHLHLDKRVALKLLLPQFARDAEIVERFIREGRAASKIHGENVVRVLDVGKLDTGETYMIMEYLDGEDLETRLERHVVLSIAEAVDIIVEACNALAEAHAQGIVHRDVKPANLYMTKTPSGEIVKIVDFGISKVLEREDGASLTLTKTHAVFGSPVYMSPEQLTASKDVDTRADIWSIGVILYELVAGVRPFTGGSVAEIHAAVLTKDPLPVTALRSGLPNGLSTAIASCLVRDPDMRATSVLEVAREIAPFGTDRARRALDRAETFAPQLPQPRPRVIEDAPTEPHPIISPSEPPSSMEVAAPPTRSRPLLWIAIVIAALGAAGGIGALVLEIRARSTRAVASGPASAPPVIVEPPAPISSATESTSATAPPVESAPTGKRQPRIRVPPHPSATASAPPAPSSDRFR